MVKVDKNKFGPWAMVTGASSGIGKEFARQLAASGLNLVLVARRLILLEALGQQLAKEYGIQYRAIGVDLSEEGFLGKIAPVIDNLDIGLLISKQAQDSRTNPGCRCQCPTQCCPTEHHQSSSVSPLPWSEAGPTRTRWRRAGLGPGSR